MAGDMDAAFAELKSVLAEQICATEEYEKLYLLKPGDQEYDDIFARCVQTTADPAKATSAEIRKLVRSPPAPRAAVPALIRARIRVATDQEVEQAHRFS